MHNRASQRAELDQKQRGSQAADRAPAGSQAEKPNSAELEERIRQRAYQLYVAGDVRTGMPRKTGALRKRRFSASREAADQSFSA